MVQMLRLSYGEDANRKLGVHQDVVNEFRRDGQAVKIQCLHALQNAFPLQAAENAPQGAGIEVIFGEILIELDIAPNLAAVVNAGDFELGRFDVGQVDVAENVRVRIEQVPKLLGGGGEVKESRDGEVRDRLAKYQRVG